MAKPQALELTDDYSTIEAAVMETARGRWFLGEYARRNRHADTEKVLEAIARLEALATQPAAAPALPAPAPALPAPGDSAFAGALRYALLEAQAAILTEARGAGPEGERIARAAVNALQQVGDRVLHGSTARPAQVRPLQAGEFDLDAVSSDPATLADLAVVESASAPKPAKVEPARAEMAAVMPLRAAPAPLALAAMVEESVVEAEITAQMPRRPALRASDLDSLSFEEKSVFFA